MTQRKPTLKELVGKTVAIRFVTPLGQVYPAVYDFATSTSVVVRVYHPDFSRAAGMAPYRLVHLYDGTLASRAGSLAGHVEVDPTNAYDNLDLTTGKPRAQDPDTAAPAPATAVGYRVVTEFWPGETPVTTVQTITR